MSDREQNEQMEDVQDPSTNVKGKGRAPAGEEPMDDDSSDESGMEEEHVSALNHSRMSE